MKSSTLAKLIDSDWIIGKRSGEQLTLADARDLMEGEINPAAWKLTPATRARIAAESAAVDTFAVGDAVEVTGPSNVNAVCIGRRGVIIEIRHPEPAYRVDVPDDNGEPYRLWYPATSLRRVPAEPVDMPSGYDDALAKLRRPARIDKLPAEPAVELADVAEALEGLKEAMGAAMLAAEPAALTADDAQWLAEDSLLWHRGSGLLSKYLAMHGNGELLISCNVAGDWHKQTGTFPVSEFTLPPATAQAIAQRKAEAAVPPEQPAEPSNAEQVDKAIWMRPGETDFAANLRLAAAIRAAAAVPQMERPPLPDNGLRAEGYNAGRERVLQALLASLKGEK